MKWNKRYTTWVVGAGACAAVVYFAPASDADVVQPGVKPEGRVSPIAMAVSQGQGPSQFSSSNQSTPQGHLQKIKSRQVAEELTLLFSDGVSSSASSAQTQLIAPALQQRQVAIAQVQAQPQAPALPFKYVGRYVGDGQAQLLLQNQGQDIVVKVGDTIGQTYKLEAMSASTLTFTFIPLNEKQTLDIGSAP